MPTATSITLTDFAFATHTLVPVKADGEKSIFRSSAATSDLQEVLTFDYSAPKANRNTTRIKGAFALPVSKTVDGELVVKSTARFSFEAIIPGDFDAAEREGFQSLITALFADANVTGMISDLDPIY